MCIPSGEDVLDSWAAPTAAARWDKMQKQQKRKNAPPPVQEPVRRQDYRQPVARESIIAGAEASRRRRVAGVSTSSQGVMDAASTTRTLQVGG